MGIRRLRFPVRNIVNLFQRSTMKVRDPIPADAEARRVTFNHVTEEVDIWISSEAWSDEASPDPAEINVVISSVDDGGVVVGDPEALVALGIEGIVRRAVSTALAAGTKMSKPS